MVKIGAKVTWQYQAGGVEFEQTGKVLSFVEAQVPAGVTLENLGVDATSRQKKFSDVSSNDRYLIEVNADGVMYYYAPMTSVVDKQNPKAVKAWEKENLKAMSEHFGDEESALITKASFPSIGTNVSFGNSKQYCVFATKGTTDYVAYRKIGKSALKFLVSGESESKFTGAYKSGVRNAYSCYATPVEDDTKVYELSATEIPQFCKALAAAVKKLGYSVVSTDLMLTDLHLTPSGSTRRNISVKFG